MLFRSINKSLEVFHSAIELIQMILHIRRYSLVFLKNLTLIQIRWKAMIRLNNLRRSVLFRKWNEMISKLIKVVKTKGKSHSQLLHRLKGISSNTIKKAVNDYYYSVKRRYYKRLTKIFFERNSKKKESSGEINIFKCLVQFKYLPKSETLEKMILDLVKV